MTLKNTLGYAVDLRTRLVFKGTAGCICYEQSY